MVPGAPPTELSRSPAAARIGALAAASGLQLACFEHRWELPAPPDWEPEGRADLGQRGAWSRGVLPEAKFRDFRLDRRIGSFHPGHRSKWTAHELCHGLVGFAWAPGKSALWQATAARLAELLPVALWYFFDEAGLRRCPDHSGPLYGVWCDACESASHLGPVVDDPAAADWRAAGRAFVDAELAAIARTRRLGRPVPHRHATLELCSDGLAYAAAHGARLASPAFAAWIERFCPVGAGRVDTLDDLEARVLALQEDLCGGAPAAPWAAAPLDWVVQDLGWRLLQLAALCEPEAAAAVEGLADALAADRSAAGVGALVSAYRALAEDLELPPVGDFFGVGYPLPGGLGRAESVVEAGLRSALPLTLGRLGEEAPEWISAFTWADPVVRRPIGHRFASFFAAETGEGPLTCQARFEAALTHAPRVDLGDWTLVGAPAAGPRLRWLRGQAVTVVSHPVQSRPRQKVPLRPLSRPRIFVTRRLPDGEAELLELPPGLLRSVPALDAGPVDAAALGLRPEETAELLARGVLLPESIDENSP